MNIVHVVRQFSPGIGGLEDAVFQLATSLSPDCKVTVVTLDRLFARPDMSLPAHDRIGDMDIVRIPYRGSSRYPVAPQILRHLDAADLVHVHAVDFFFDFLALTRWRHRKPLVASTHGGFFHTRFASTAKHMWFNGMTRFTSRAYGAICASSQADLDMFRGIAPGNSILAENGVDIAKWHDASSMRLVPTMLYIGRFTRHKNIDLLFPVLRALRDDTADWRLIVAGVPSDLTADALMAAAREQGVADRVEILTGLSAEAMKAVIGRASYIVSPSDHEGFGLTIIEGLSAGLHPIVSGIPAFTTFRERTGRGQTVDFRRPAEAAAAITAAHRAHGQDAAAGRLVNIRASAVYDWGSAAQRFADIYRTVLQRGSIKAI